MGRKSKLFQTTFSLLLSACMLLSCTQAAVKEVALAADGIGVTAEGEDMIYDLLTNGQENPAAVDEPSFSWKLSSSRRGAGQTAYRIFIATDKSFENTVYDSGSVSSQRSSSVSVDFVPQADTTYFWKVVITTDAGEKVNSEIATFNVGLPVGGWKAKYIWNSATNVNNFKYLRKNFNLENKKIKRAYVYASAHNDYQLYLNGEFLGAGPARSDPYRYGQYIGYDISALLQEGENNFSALAHWHGAFQDSGVNARPAFILQASIEYEDGSRQLICSDESWKTSKTPYVEEDPVYFGMYGGEQNRASVRYDARQEIPNWNSVGYDDSAWDHAVVVDRSDFGLYAQITGQEKEQETLSPQTITQKNGKYYVDFGKCITGWPRLTMHQNNAGDTVTDYVTVTPVSENSTTATVKCLQPFGEQINVIVTSNLNATVSAKCNVDFVKRVQSATANCKATLFDGTEKRITISHCRATANITSSCRLAISRSCSISCMSKEVARGKKHIFSKSVVCSSVLSSLCCSDF